MKLFKYYAFNENSLLSLFTDTLWFSNPDKFNDPYDSNLNYLIKAQNERGRGFRVTALEKIRGSLGVCCFTERWSNVHLWTHYAGHHSGFCVEYDLAPVEQMLNNYGIPMLLESVYYSKYPYSDFDSNIPEHLAQRVGQNTPYNLDLKQIDALTQGLILTKDEALWAKEEEHRMIITPTLAARVGESTTIRRGTSGYTMQLPKESIKRVFFGCQMDEQNARLLDDFLSYKRDGYVEKRWVKLGPTRGELVADSEPDLDLDGILSGKRMHSNKM